MKERKRGGAGEDAKERKRAGAGEDAGIPYNLGFQIRSKTITTGLFGLTVGQPPL